MTREEIIDLFKQGASVPMIARMANKAHGSIYAILKRSGNYEYRQSLHPIPGAKKIYSNPVEDKPFFNSNSDEKYCKAQMDKKQLMDNLHTLHSNMKYKYDTHPDIINHILEILEPLEIEFLPFEAEHYELISQHKPRIGKGS